MKYRVSVADPKSGREYNIDIDAATEQNARAIATGNGLLVSSCALITKREDLVAKHAEIGLANLPVTPEYAALRAVGNYHIGQAVIGYILGGLLIIGGLVGALLAREPNDRKVCAAVAGLGLTALVYSLFAHGFGQLLHAVRDMARNSFSRH